MSSGTRRIVLSIIVVAIAGAAAWWWQDQQRINPAPGLAASAPPTPAPEPTAQAASEPAIQYPLPTPEDQAPLAVDGIAPALTDLLGRKAVDAFLQLGDFPRRVVATVDNLGRGHAPASLWPVNPTAGRFTVLEQGGGAVIAPGNGARYTALVALAESIDPAKAVNLYVQMYPLLQRAYQDLGYPRAYFNDRLIQVIDLLLASPVPGGTVAVQLTEVKGPEPSVRPWVRYEFADPALESLAAGQKIMVRVGSANERRLKARLTALRQELTARVLPR